MGDEYHHCITLFDDHPEGDGVLIAPQPVWMRVEREELPWINICFESPRPSPTQLLRKVEESDVCSKHFQGVSDVGIKFPIFCLRTCSLSRQHLDLEVLISMEVLR